MRNETLLFLQSVITGAALLFCYDILRAARRAFPHCPAAVAAEDLLYWAGCGIGVSAAVYRANQGILRFFLFLGVGLGAWLFSVTVSGFFVKICAGMLKIPVKTFNFLIKWLLFPARRCKILLYHRRKTRRLRNRKTAKKGRLANWLKRRKREKEE